MALEQDRQGIRLGDLREEVVEENAIANTNIPTQQADTTPAVQPKRTAVSFRQLELEEMERMSEVDLERKERQDDSMFDKLFRDITRFSFGVADATKPGPDFIVRALEADIGMEPETAVASGLNAFVRGFSSVVANTFTTGLAGLARSERKYNPSKVLLRMGQGKKLEEGFTPVEEYFFNAGKQIQSDLEEIFPEREDLQGTFMASILPGMAGGLLAQMGGGGAVRAVGGSIGAATTITAAITGVAFSGVEFQNALEKTGDIEEATNVFIANLPINSIPIKIQAGQFFKRLDIVTKGGLGKYLKGNIATKFAKATSTQAGAALGGGIEGAVTNIMQEAGVNAVAGNTYDEGRRITDGLAEIGAASGLVGLALNVFGVRMAKAQRRKDISPEAKAELVEIEKHIAEVRKELGPEDKALIDAFDRGPNQKFNNRVKDLREKIQQREISEKFAKEELDRLERDLMDMPDADSFYKHLESVESTRAMLEGTPSGELPFTHDPNKPKSIEEQSTMPFDSEGFKSRAQSKFKAFVSEWFTPKGRFTKDVHRRIMQKIDEEQSMIFKAVIRHRELKAAIRKDFGVKDIFDPNKFPRRTMVRLNDALAGDVDILNSLPNDTRRSILKMREHIDLLSKTFINEGAVSGDLKMTIESNLGTYLHRTYKVFSSDPAVRAKWIENVPKDIRNRAEAFIRDIYAQRGTTPKKGTVERIINNILYKGETSLFILSQSGDKKKDLHPVKIRDDIFKMRTDIPDPIRALMGETVNPISNYVNSIQNMAHVIAEHRFLSDLGENFDGTIVSKQVDIVKGHTELIDMKIQGLDLPTNKVYTTPELAKAFDELYNPKHMEGMLKAYMTVNAVTKYAKTVGSLATHFRNVYGGNFFLMAAGHVPTVKGYRDGIGVVKRTLVGVPDAQLEARIKEYYELGLLDKDVRAGELRDVLNDINIREDAMFGSGFDHLGAKANSLYGKVKLGAETMTRIYQAEDNLIRIVFFEAEKARYQAADPNMTDRQVADIVRDTYQDYTQISKAVKILRTVPLIGPFVAFPHEVIRTSINNAILAKQEITSSNPKIRKIGAQRIAGLTVMATVGTAASMATRAMFGISEQDDADARLFDSEWNRNAEKLYLGYDGNGRVKSLNLSYVDPYAILKEPVLAILRNDDKTAEEKLTEAFRSFSEPFLNEEILAQKLREVLTNNKSVGGPVYNPKDSWGNRSAAKFAHLWDGFEPGTITSARSIIESLGNDPLEDEKELSEEMLAIVGMRVVTTDVRKSFPFDVRDFNAQVRNIRALTSRMDTQELDTPEGFERKALAEREERGILNDMTKRIEAAKRLGVPSYDLEVLAREAGMSKTKFQELEYGIALPESSSDIMLRRFKQEIQSLKP